MLLAASASDRLRGLVVSAPYTRDVVARYVSRDAAASRRNESGCKDLDHAARLLRLGSAIQRTILIQDTVGKNRRADDSELDGLRRTRPSVRGYD